MDKPILIDIKERKHNLIDLGEKKLRDLYNLRVKMEIIRDIGDDKKLEELEEKELDLVYDLNKIDLGIKTLEAAEYIIENNIFGKYWEKIEESLDTDKLLEIFIKNGLNIKKSCLELYNMFNINDKSILKKIEKLPDEEKCMGECDNKITENIIERLKSLKNKLMKGE